MSEPFLTVREAALFTGKSPSSIRRLLHPILQAEKHADRQFIQPSVDEVLKLRMKGESFPWRVSEEFLRRAVPPEIVSEKGAGAPSKGSNQDETPLLAMLRRELDIKNQQITQQGELISKQMELISGLGERLREGNILIGALQQRLTLPDGKEKSSQKPIVTKPREATSLSETGTEAGPKALEPKKRFLSRLFR